MRNRLSAYNLHVAPSDKLVRTELPFELRTLLQTLRWQLRRYCLLSGLLGMVIAAVVTFWATAGLDLGWFAFRRIELPVGLRAALQVVMLIGAVLVLYRSVLLPVWRRIQDRDLALLLERQFPEFQDRLITAVEGAQGLPISGPLTSHMIVRTVTDAGQLSRSTQSNDVFDHTLLKKRGCLAGILILSVVGVEAAAPETFPRWWNAFVRCEVVYHERTTDIEVRVVQQPGNRRLAFRNLAGEYVYLHPRGNDLELELTVPEGHRPGGEPWVIPQRVRVDVRRADGTTSRTYVAPASHRLFRYVITRLQQDIEVELLAGDFRIPQPLIVRSVPPPVLDEILLECDFPDYTGWNHLRDTVRRVTGSETSLPVGTQFRLEAVCSKPLQALRIAANDFDLSGDMEGSLIKSHDGGISVRGPGLISADGLRVTAEFLLIPQDDSSPPMKNSGATAEQIPGPEAAPSLSGKMLSIVPDTTLKFSLHDQDDIMSTRPVVFRVRGIKDNAPVIDVHTAGVDSAITRRAVLPFRGSIRDDYGLQSAEFEFTVDDESYWRSRPFASRVSKDTTKFVLGSKSTASNADTEQELFQVQPLDLTEGQTLSIALTASDGCTIGDVNVTRSDPVVYRVVSNEELLSLLYAREINLRRRFEEVLREIRQVQEDLAFHEVVARRIDSAGDEAKSEDRVGLTTCATRSGNSLRRQTNELKSILLGFDGIIRQLINNAVPPAQLSETMRQKIVVPLQEVVEMDLPRADRVVSRFQVAAKARQSSVMLVTESERAVGSVVARLSQVLEDVRDMAEFHEVLSDLRALRELQKQIYQDTRRLKRQRLIDGL